MEFKDALDAIVVDLRNMIQELIGSAAYDRCYTGVIVFKSGVRVANKYEYEVQIGGSTRHISSSCNKHIGDYVKVLVPCNSWDKAFFIAEADGSAVIRNATNAMLEKNYIPKTGELIVFNRQGGCPQLKFGDGVTRINSLPFFGTSDSSKEYPYIFEDVDFASSERSNNNN